MNTVTIKEVAYIRDATNLEGLLHKRYEYMSYYVNRGVKVKHSSPSSDYQSLMYIINRREITHR